MRFCQTGIWRIGNNNPKILPTIIGTVNRTMYDDCDDFVSISMKFTITNYTASGLRIKSVECSTNGKKNVKLSTFAEKYIIKV